MAILGLVATMSEQFVEQTVPMTPSLIEITNHITSQVMSAFAAWDERLTVTDLCRIEFKLKHLSGQIPMDRPYEIEIFTAFLLVLLEDLTKKMKNFYKRKAVERVTEAVLGLHEYLCSHDGGEYEHLMEGARSAECWGNQPISSR
jgi:hypothetical protein